MPSLLHSSRLPDLLALSTAAGWNQTAEDWLRLLELEPEGCFGIEQDGRIVASATVITYGPDLAWIGMVLTLPGYRGRGFATTLMRRCLDFCRQRSIRTVRLDATEMGRPVYERLGFLPEYAVSRWQGHLPAAAARPWQPDFELDRLAFGADRRRLLERTGCCRPGRVASYVGPVTARTASEARGILLHCGISGPAFWDIPEANPAACALAEELGFRPVRRLVRMRSGPPVEERPEFVFALAGFEYG
ncbi:MAG: GNAT family N-acetyltransferase [Bryobacteraceae bacterium]|nr:GNAT family N-acetyltransferase [Bryobacteraceae bacterium]